MVDLTSISNKSPPWKTGTKKFCSKRPLQPEMMRWLQQHKKNIATTDSMGFCGCFSIYITENGNFYEFS